MGWCQVMRMPSRISVRALTSGPWLIPRAPRRPRAAGSRSVKMAGDLVSGRLFVQQWLLLGADRGGVRTARMEATARRRIERAGHLALHDDLVARVVRMRRQRVGEQDLRVGMEGVRVELLAGGRLHELAQIHDAD